MPFVSATNGTFGYGRGIITTDSPIVSGNGLATMSVAGATAIPGVAGADDTFGYIPTSASFPWFFYGINYGSGAASQFFWSTNNLIGFGTGNGANSWAANTGRAILWGFADRRTSSAYYFPETTNRGFRILKLVAFFQNNWNTGGANEGQVEIRFARSVSSGLQYIEFRIFRGSPSVNSGAITITGTWNITNGTAFQGTFGSTFNTTYPAGNTSFTLSSDANGNNWVFQNTTYLNI